MTTNRFARSEDNPDRIIPPKDEADRQAFWVAHGNDSLAQKGRSNLQWKCVNGSYFIEPR